MTKEIKIVPEGFIDPVTFEMGWKCGKEHNGGLGIEVGKGGGGVVIKKDALKIARMIANYYGYKLIKSKL